MRRIDFSMGSGWRYGRKKKSQNEGLNGMFPMRGACRSMLAHHNCSEFGSSIRPWEGPFAFFCKTLPTRTALKRFPGELDD